MDSTDLDRARAVKEQARLIFSQRATVAGVGITRIGDRYGMKVNLSAPPSPDADLPATIDGVPIRVEVVGTIHTL